MRVNCRVSVGLLLNRRETTATANKVRRKVPDRVVRRFTRAYKKVSFVCYNNKAIDVRRLLCARRRFPRVSRRLRISCRFLLGSGCIKCLHVSQHSRVVNRDICSASAPLGLATFRRRISDDDEVRENARSYCETVFSRSFYFFIFPLLTTSTGASR